MRVLVTFAVDAEFAPWRKLRPFARIEKQDCYRANAGDLELLIVFTGVGAKKPWLAAAQSMWGTAVDVCIASGLAGGLKPWQQVGDVIAPRAVADASGGIHIACDGELADLAKGCGAQNADLLRSVDHVVSSAEEKQQIGESADAADMETAVVLGHAARLGARCVSIRAISDTVGEDLPLDFNRAVTPAGDVSIPRVIGALALHPSALPGLLRFGRRSHEAAEKLARFLEGYVQGVARVHGLAKV